MASFVRFFFLILCYSWLIREGVAYAGWMSAPFNASRTGLLSASSSVHCSWWQFQCRSGQCISKNWVCDGYRDCYDGSDEYCSSSGTAAISPSTTVYRNCSHGQFGCNNGQCISASYLCDGHRNCYDGSDEDVSRCQGNTKKCQDKVDLGFILDSSGSISYSDFENMKIFVKNLTSFFTISLDETRVSVMSFSSTNVIHIRFNEYFPDKFSFDTKVNYTPYLGGGTNTATALNVAYTTMFTSAHGARNAGIKKVLIVLTDGYSNGMVSGPAQSLENAGIVIFSVGIGSSVSMQELYEMASNPKDQHVIRLDNFNQLSVIAEQMSSKTCNASHFQVLCSSNDIEVVFDRANLPPYVSMNRLRLIDLGCRANSNQSHVFFRVPLKGCGTIYSETDLTISFTNVLSEELINSTSGDVITRSNLFKAKFTCTYGRRQTVGSFSFEPSRQTLSVVQNAMGNFTLSMNVFQSHLFSNVYTVYDYPVFKSLADYIYIQYAINTTNDDLVVHAETCKATPTNRPYDSPQYVFIDNGCDNDTTIRHFTNGMNSVQRFSIQAFRFLTNHRFVYIHCDLVVCNRRFNNSTCARGNSCTRRHRRDVSKMTSSDDSAQTYALSLGPLMYSKDSDNAGKQQDSTNGVTKHTAMIGSLVGVACLAFVLSGVVVFMVKKNHLRKVMPVDSPPVVPLEGQQTSN